MLEGIRDACIFLIIAQILMILVPGETYAKYVRVLISIILILKITQPILNLVADTKQQEQLEINMEQLQQTIYVPGTDEEMIRKKQQLYEMLKVYIEQEVEQDGTGIKGEDEGQ